MSAYSNFETVKAEFVADNVLHVQLNRPRKLNAFNPTLVKEVREIFHVIRDDRDIRAVVVSGSGRMFTAGLDLSENGLAIMDNGMDVARGAFHRRRHIEEFQAAFTAIEQCDKPVIAAIHNGCFGAGVDMITACDIRYATKDSFFCVKEVDVGLAADVGTLQRLPKVIGNNSLVRELCFTGRNLYADEALQCGLINKVLGSQEEVVAEALKTAKLIASKSPVAVVGTKNLLNYSRDHSVAEGLEYTVTWNAAMLNTEDIPRSVEAFVTKKPAVYSKL
ncbi:ClpP/crotonase-like domain-containing protein [Umbelopsis sp. PMI_123]|nr:ClpP/crotonase-like domain-containing protein [Umbelopsis sp. PMI_123]